MNSLTHTLPTSPVVDTSIRIGSEPQPATRILVLVPSLELDLTESARKVWGLTQASGTAIHFIGMCEDLSQDSTVQRGLTFLSTMVQGEHVSTSMDVVSKKEWSDLVCRYEKGADLVVYFPGHQTASSRKTISLPTQLAFWIMSLLVLVGFFFIQVGIARFFSDWLQTLLLMLSTLVEFGLIWLVDRLM